MQKNQNILSVVLHVKDDMYIGVSSVAYPADAPHVPFVMNIASQSPRDVKISAGSLQGQNNPVKRKSYV